MKTKITFTKLKRTNTWGVLVETKDTLDLAGEVVEVSKKDGSSSRVKVGSRVWAKRIGAKTITAYTIADKHPKRVLTSDLGAVGSVVSRDEAEYQQGKAEVEQIQAISRPGSALREALYLEMEMARYNRGED